MAKGTIEKISARAQKIYKNGNAGKTWHQSIKAASAEYNNGKLGSSGNTRTATKAHTSGNRTSTSTKTITAHVKVGRKKKKAANRQTGTSNRVYDQQRTARPPGARKPKGGKKVTYYERRKNRSDVPGKLTGTQQNEVAIRHLRENNTALAAAELLLNQLKERRKHAVKIKARFTANELKYRINDQKKLIKAIKSSIRMLRVLVK